MKRLAKLFISVVFLFAALFLALNLLFSAFVKRNENEAVIWMNRVFSELQESMENEDPGQAEEKIAELDRKMQAGESPLSKKKGAPDRICYYPAEAGNSEVSLINKEDASVRLWALHHKGRIIGFVGFVYRDAVRVRLRLLMNLCLAAALIITLSVCFYINSAILAPFGKLAAYPEKLSKNEMTEKIPETKNRLFGRFVWGINMLSDNLENKKRRINELSREHLTMMTTIAHGIKTPVANIKLYADAISTGLYQPDGVINEKDAEVAAKISKNADDVTELVKELIEKASAGIADFEPEVEPFYLKEIEEFIRDRFAMRLEVLRIPLSIEAGHNAMIKSDKSGICRILSQLVENAVKYGNGEGISLNLDKEGDGFYFIVKNRGQVPDENELPYLFNSFWRGSNASGVAGSGIGLFEAREIARKLYGDIYVKTDPEHGEIEFTVYIPIDGPA
ncbi:MAG: HAMP domain-containing histidine kinase [Lachnospiraceae bacterium]|nr:HAMP domain-containing histidine kinase [Lachnospiraceae bacterium]